jgi:hypothetical protein
MFQMFLLCFGEDNDIIYIDETYLPDQSRLLDVHESLERCRRIPDPKNHSQEAVQAFVRRECCFCPIIGMYRDLPIAGVAVKSTEDGRVPKRVNTFLHARQVL